jgi:hypothetical protein
MRKDDENDDDLLVEVTGHDEISAKHKRNKMAISLFVH